LHECEYGEAHDGESGHEPLPCRPRFPLHFLTMAENLEERISNALGIRVRSVVSLSGGCIGEVYQASLENGEAVVVKVDRRTQPCLDIEGYMLEYLAEHTPLPVPNVRSSAPGLLIMEYLPGDSRFSVEAERHAAELLAATHDVRAEQFGLERGTLIGSLTQPNRWTASWLEFFREQRLLHMAEIARRDGPLPPAVFKRLQAFAQRLDDFLEEPPYPSLLHGDVWTTNVLAQHGRITGFLDPAVYYGHPEIELAFITLFSTFGRSFFDRYEELRPIRPGFLERRRDIYNLYPLLVHVRHFGLGYLGGIESTLGRLGF